MTILFRAVVVFVYIFILAPIAFVVLSSFGGREILAFPPTEFTLRWYENISSSLVDGLVTSLIVAGVTVVLAVLFGTGLAMAIARGRGTYVGILKSVTAAPLALPHLAIGIAAFHASLLVWDGTGLQLAGSRAGLVLAHLVIAMPYVIRAVTVGHEHFDRSIEEAALNLGASRFYTVRRVTLPTLMPGILSGALLAFLASFDDVPIALFMGGGTDSTTLPIKILQAVEFSFEPDVMAISSLLVLVTILLMVVLDRLVGLERFFGAGRSG
jgi:putative spermidine/putrescine transport system permease protein